MTKAEEPGTLGCPAALDLAGQRLAAQPDLAVGARAEHQAEAVRHPAEREVVGGERPAVQDAGGHHRERAGTGPHAAREVDVDVRRAPGRNRGVDQGSPSSSGKCRTKLSASQCPSAGRSVCNETPVGRQSTIAVPGPCVDQSTRQHETYAVQLPSANSWMAGFAPTSTGLRSAGSSAADAACHRRFRPPRRRRHRRPRRRPIGTSRVVSSSSSRSPPSRGPRWVANAGRPAPASD